MESGLNGEDLIERIYSEFRFDPLFLSVVGSHLFEFEMEDSDYDVAGVYALPLENALSIHGYAQNNYQTKFPEAEVSLYEIGKFLRLLLHGNGNAYETLYSPHIVSYQYELHEIREVFDRYVTEGHKNHYLGVSRSHYDKFLKERKIKYLLHTYRALLSGIYLFDTGHHEFSLAFLARVYSHEFVLRLIEERQSGNDDWTFLYDHSRLYDALVTKLTAKSVGSVPNRNDVDAVDVNILFHKILART